MRACPNCGYENEETAAVCVQCNQVLPPPAPPEDAAAGAPMLAPIQFSGSPGPSPTGPGKGRQYLLGLGLGLIPLVLFLIGVGLSFNGVNTGLATILLYASLALFIGAIIATIVCLILQRVRFVGYGLLTAVSASPVIGFIGCLVIFSASNARL